jgi:adenylate cyclase
MTRKARVIVEGVVPFVAAGILFGLIYNTLFYPHTMVEYTEAATVGLLLGIAAGMAEQTALERWLRHRPLLHAVAVRTVLYAAAVAVVLAVVLSIEPATLGACSFARCIGEYLAGPQFLRDLAFSTAFVFFAAFAAQVVLLIGTRNFARLLLGTYRRPREVYAVFMFVDLRDSTKLAEQLGHKRYSAFLSDFFNDVSDAIYAAKGEVYQYVGDQVVVVWLGDQPARWLACFELMRQRLRAATPAYLAKYGAAPEFKAGGHAGRVVVTEVGTLQRALVYHGDVLNAAARIQAKCNETGFDLLVSEEVVSGTTPAPLQQFEKVGALHLRGKSEELVVYGLREPSALGLAIAER